MMNHVIQRKAREMARGFNFPIEGRITGSCRSKGGHHGKFFSTQNGVVITRDLNSRSNPTSATVYKVESRAVSTVKVGCS